ncbi:MAG: bifunctional adenosylcobinamide kinase/adenosylcobinamide-phosphate guanylyltransferase [Chloroflexi bacterium]|nr:MAG: bifunctional adenosylcobinamide kinase/adenosylcobinamide-phosphate guanylyltransferase [Chloroflexota bacterium]
MSTDSWPPWGWRLVGDLHFVIGGASSGKSGYAVERTKALGGDLVTFVATARPGDAELDARIAAHRRARPRSWRTMEADADLADAVARSAATDVILLDSLTLWVAALVSARETGDRMWPAVALAIAARERAVVVVSDEVGLGLVPETEVGRRFRDELGRLNQRVAHAATSAVLVVAGVPLRLAP